MSKAELKGFRAALDCVEGVLKGVSRPVDPVWVIELVRESVAEKKEKN